MLLEEVCGPRTGECHLLIDSYEKYEPLVRKDMPKLHSQHIDFGFIVFDDDISLYTRLRCPLHGLVVMCDQDHLLEDAAKCGRGPVRVLDPRPWKNLLAQRHFNAGCQLTRPCL